MPGNVLLSRVLRQSTIGAERAAVALIDVDGRILISKRPENKYLGGLWEFPGGKLENTERAEDALIRELDEELNIQTWKSWLAPLTFSTHDYTDFNLLLLLFVCRKWDGIIMGREGQEIKWVFPKELNKFPMPDADKPLIPFLRDLL